MKIIGYYATGLRGRKVAQLWVERGTDGKMRQWWTGVTYKSNREAQAAISKLNCSGAIVPPKDATFEPAPVPGWDCTGQPALAKVAS